MDLLAGIIPLLCSRHPNVHFIIGIYAGTYTALSEITLGYIHNHYMLELVGCHTYMSGSMLILLILVFHLKKKKNGGLKHLKTKAYISAKTHIPSFLAA